MTAGWFGRGLGVATGVAVVFALTAQIDSAQAGRARSNHHVSRAGADLHNGYARAHARYDSYHRTSWASGLQCVPFARENSGIELSGNAGTWWDSAEGLYERGARPEVGSILNFRSTRRIRMGHVAVVTNVLDGRHIEIDHANWGGPGKISRNIDVVDVSPANDWTAVRVELGHTDAFGGVYPTYGFIYDRPDHGTMVANKGVIAAPASQQQAASDLGQAPEEVAEAEDDSIPSASTGHHYSAPRHGSHWARSHHPRYVQAQQSAYHAGHGGGLTHARKHNRHF